MTYHSLVYMFLHILVKPKQMLQRVKVNTDVKNYFSWTISPVLVLERHPYYLRMPSMSHLPSFKEGIVHESPSYTGRISFESSNEGCDKGTHNGFGWFKISGLYMWEDSGYIQE